MDLLEMMQARAEQVKAMRAMLDKVKAESREFTPEEDTQFVGIEAKVRTLDKQIEREQALAEREKELQMPAEPTFRPSAAYGGSTQQAKKEDYGFSSLGEFLNAVRFGDSKGRLDAIRNEMSMGVSENGGIMVPEEFRGDLLRVTPESAIVRPRANVIPAGSSPDATVTMPALDQVGKNMYGGVEVTWIGEGGEKPETTANLSEVKLTPYEVAAHITVTDKLLRNWDASEAVIKGLLNQAMTAAEDLAFLTGNGTGKPKGVIGSTAALTVKRATANKITTLDVVSMVANLLPGAEAIFVAHQSTMIQLITLKDEAGNSIFIQGNLAAGIPSTLLGYPIRFTGKTSALGTKGDLILVDLSYYLIKDGAGPYVMASEHVYFKQNKTVIKAFWNVDGKAWLTGPLKLEDGVTTVSPFVVLEVPAP